MNILNIGFEGLKKIKKNLDEVSGVNAFNNTEFLSTYESTKDLSEKDRDDVIEKAFVDILKKYVLDKSGEFFVAPNVFSNIPLEMQKLETGGKIDYLPESVKEVLVAMKKFYSGREQKDLDVILSIIKKH